MNGMKLSFEDVGAGQPLVFLHGFPLSRDAWRKQIETFGASFRVIAPDLRGFGGSATREGSTTMLEYASDVHELLQQLDTGPVVLIGHSLGGLVALAFASHFPEMLCGLVLVNTTAGPDSSEGAALRRAMASRIKEDGVDLIVRTAATTMLSTRSQNLNHIARVLGLMASANPAGVTGALLGMAERPDATPGLARIAMPALVIAGADDVIVPVEEAEKLVRGIRGSQLRIIPHAGHLVAFEQPKEFNRRLREWLDQQGMAGPRDFAIMTTQEADGKTTGGHLSLNPVRL